MVANWLAKCPEKTVRHIDFQHQTWRLPLKFPEISSWSNLIFLKFQCFKLKKWLSPVPLVEGFKAELARLRRDFIGGPTPLYHAKRLTDFCGGAQIWFKREELAHTGAHKINNAIGQALVAVANRWMHNGNETDRFMLVYDLI